MLGWLPCKKQCLLLLNHIVIVILLMYLSHLARHLASLLLQVLKYTLGKKTQQQKCIINLKWITYFHCFNKHRNKSMEWIQIVKSENTKKSSWESQISPQTQESPAEVCSAMRGLKHLGWADLTNKLLLQAFSGTLCLLFLSPTLVKHLMQNTFPSISNTEMFECTHQTSTQFLLL